jgi:hypothetical protein
VFSATEAINWRLKSRLYFADSAQNCTFVLQNFYICTMRKLLGTTTLNLSILALLVSIGISSCKNNDRDLATTKFKNGAFIINEGPYGNGTGTVSYLNKDNNQISPNVYGDANASTLGNVVNSLNVRNNEAWVIVNNADVARVVNLTDFELQKSIGSFRFPRYMKDITSTKSYFTEWTDSPTASVVRVYDHQLTAFVKAIYLPNGAEEIAVVGNRAYVTCNGGFSNNDKLAIIDITKDSLIGLVSIGPNPDGIQVDANNHVWVLCSGQWNSNFTALTQPGKLVRYNTITATIDRDIPTPSAFAQPQNLKINGSKNQLYFNFDGAVHTMNVNATALGGAVVNGYFYGLGIDPSNGDIYCCDAGNFASNGKLRRFTSAGVVKDSFTVGVIPSDVVFINQ